MSTRTYQIIIGVLLLLLIFMGWKAFSDKGTIDVQEEQIFDLSSEKKILKEDLQEMLDE